MVTRTLEVELPEEIIDLLGSPEVAAAKAREALVLELLREARISQSQASQVLGISRWQLLGLMAERQVPSGPESPEELRHEIEAIRRHSKGA